MDNVYNLCEEDVNRQHDGEANKEEPYNQEWNTTWWIYINRENSQQLRIILSTRFLIIAWIIGTQMKTVCMRSISISIRYTKYVYVMEPISSISP